MDKKSVYNSIIQTKNGSYIPVFSSNKTVESRYNPENSCDLIVNSISKSGFFVITGIASGILIQKLLQKFPECKILAVEYSSSDITFLKQLEIVESLSKIENVIFCSIENLYKEMLNNYLPSIYGDFQLIQQKPWLLEHPELNNCIPEIINECLKKISADYSVQSHFGKRWQKNIHTNLKLLNKKSFIPQSFDFNKTAAIIAAGPSLDKTIEHLKKNRETYVIFSTDTAYSTLIKHKIFPEAVISIDGQLISFNHFFNINNRSHFYFDLCGNSSAIKNVLKHSDNIHLFVSGHPFCNLINNYFNNQIPTLYTGSGTVTISALDLAIKFGFQKIEIFGADFAYLDGKAYTKGTYLDSLYSRKATKIRPLEIIYDKLIYRVPLKALEKNSYTTAVLESYKVSLEEYLKANKCDFYIENNQYFIKSFNLSKIDYKSYILNYNDFYNYFNSLSDNELKIPLLPLSAYLRKNKPDESFEKLLKLARSIVVSYN